MSKIYDVIVIGGALNGLASAVALGGSSLRRPLDVFLVDSQNPVSFASTAFDGRASALTASARNMLLVLGVWEKLEPVAQAFREIIVTDARPGDHERPVLLNFGEAEPDDEPTAYMVENRHLYETLLQLAEASPHITFATGKTARRFEYGPGLTQIHLEDGSEYRANLIVAADGRNSRAREAAGIAMKGWPYGQTGIVVTVEHELPHHGRAEEHFTPSGPFAILPLKGNRSSLVWTEREGEARRILELPEDQFVAELRKRFGTHLGTVTLASERHGYPLAIYLAKEFTATRLALVGDAAHIVHPLAGLGFNLGLRDVAALAECIHDAAALGLDPGGRAVLERYAMWRRFDTVMTATSMDALNRLFSNNSAITRTIRDLGLSAVNRIPPLKTMFAKEAAGYSGNLPKLMRGELP